MNHLRWSVLALAVFLFVFIFIQLLVGSDGHPAGLQNFVYVLGLLAVCSIVGIVAVGRMPVISSLLGWGGIYLLCKLIVAAQDARPLIGGAYTYIAITEIVFIELAVLLAHNLANNLRDLDKSLENFALETVGRRLRKFDEAVQDIQIELNRSRRHQHALSVIVVEPQPLSIEANMQRIAYQVRQSIMRRMVIATMGQAISGALRCTDMMLEQGERGRVVILCPETDASSSRELAERIQSIALERLGLKVGFGIHDFPDGALTLDQLIQQVELPVNTGEPASLVAENNFQKQKTSQAPAFHQPQSMPMD